MKSKSVTEAIDKLKAFVNILICVKSVFGHF